VVLFATSAIAATNLALFGLLLALVCLYRVEPEPLLRN